MSVRFWCTIDGTALRSYSHVAVITINKGSSTAAEKPRDYYRPVCGPSRAIGRVCVCPSGRQLSNEMAVDLDIWFADAARGGPSRGRS